MPDIRFDSRVAIVTGAGGGLGRAHALLLAARGARVVVNDSGGAPDGSGASAAPAASVAAEINTGGGRAIASAHSVATPEGGAAIVQTAMDAFGRCDILINNAGVVLGGTIRSVSAPVLNSTLDVHLRGAIHTIQPAWPIMREQGYGRVLNVVSNAGLFGLAENIAYAAAKGALVALTRSLALQAAPHNIKVNALAPAAYTRLTANVPDSSFLQWLKRRCDPALVSPVVAWLVHEDCPVSGEIYSTGGGRVARVFVGETAGYVNPLLTAEDVRDHFAQIRDETGYFVPGSAVEEIAAYRRVLN